MLAGKVALVTGASRGIGKAIACKLAREGAKVIINYNGSKEKAEAVKSEIEAAGGQAEVYQCDVSDYTACETFIQTVIKEEGSLDILVNNAGITKDGLLMKMSEEDFDKVLDTNLKGAFNTIRFCIQTDAEAKRRTDHQYVLRRRRQRQCRAGQLRGFQGRRDRAYQSGGKRTASRGITVNAIAPGFIETDMTDVLSDKVKEASEAQIPLGHFGKPEDVAAAAAFLASEEARYITGQVLHVDGGMVM